MLSLRTSREVDVYGRTHLNLPKPGTLAALSATRDRRPGALAIRARAGHLEAAVDDICPRSSAVAGAARRFSRAGLETRARAGLAVDDGRNRDGSRRPATRFQEVDSNRSFNVVSDDGLCATTAATRAEGRTKQLFQDVGRASTTATAEGIREILEAFETLSAAERIGKRIRVEARLLRRSSILVVRRPLLVVAQDLAQGVRKPE